MRIRIIYAFLLAIAAGLTAKAAKAAPLFQSFDKKTFYEILKSGSAAQIDSQLSMLDNSSLTEKEAYEGALLMKKAGLVQKPKEKINFFRAGRIKLEKALLSDGDNAEYHFLRLIIQEHAPKIVKYKDQLEQDSRFIKKYFRNLSPLVQERIMDYGKTSGVLHTQDF